MRLDSSFIDSATRLTENNSLLFSDLISYLLNYSTKCDTKNNSDADFFREKANLALKVFADDNLNLSIETCSVSHVTSHMVDEISNDFQTFFKENTNMDDFHRAHVWCRQLDTETFFIPLSMNSTYKKRLVSKDEALNKIILPALKASGIQIEELVDIIKSIALKNLKYSNVEPINKKININVNIWPFSDSLILGLLFYGLSDIDIIRNNNIKININLESPYENKIIRNMRSNFETNVDLSYSSATKYKSAEESPHVRDEVILADGKESSEKYCATTIRENKVQIAGISPYYKDFAKKVGKNSPTISFLSLLSDYMPHHIMIEKFGEIPHTLDFFSNESMDDILTMAHLPIFLLAGSSNTTGLFPTPDSFVWARDIGILAWDHDLPSRLVHYDAVYTEERGSRATFDQLYLDLYQDTGYGDAHYKFVSMVKKILGEITVMIGQAFDELESARAKTSKDAEFLRNAMMTPLSIEGNSYKGVLDLMTTRGFLHNASKMEQYAEYRPAIADYVDEIFGTVGAEESSETGRVLG